MSGWCPTVYSGVRYHIKKLAEEDPKCSYIKLYVQELCCVMQRCVPFRKLYQNIPDGTPLCLYFCPNVTPEGPRGAIWWSKCPEVPSWLAIKAGSVVFLDMVFML